MIKTQVTVVLAAWIASGCAMPPALPLSLSPSQGANTQVLTGTSVSLSKDNYTIVKANAVGESWGVNLLGLIPVKTPYYAEAITQIYQQSNIQEGKAQALVNIVHQKSSTFYLLFSIPRITLRADVVEFQAEGGDY